MATLTLPYHPCIPKLQPRLSEMGIRLTFSSNSTIQQKLKCKPSREEPRGSVYVINCIACTDVYIGQTGRNLEERMADHSYSYETRDGAVRKHQDIPGHRMYLENATPVCHSDCYYTRVTAEAALIHLAPTVQRNTLSASNNNNDLVAPVI